MRFLINKVGFITVGAIMAATFVYGTSHLVRTLEGISPIEIQIAILTKQLFKLEYLKSDIIEYSSSHPYLFEWWLRRVVEACIICIPIALHMKKEGKFENETGSILKNMEQVLPIGFGWWLLVPFHLYVLKFPTSWHSPKDAQELASEQFMALLHSILALLVFLFVFAYLQTLFRARVSPIPMVRTLLPIMKRTKQTSDLQANSAVLSVKYQDLELECKTGEIYRFSKSFVNLLTSFLYGLFLILLFLIIPYILIVKIDLGDFPKIKFTEIISIFSIIIVAPFIISAVSAAIFSVSRKAFVIAAAILLFGLVAIGAHSFWQNYPSEIQGDTTNILWFRILLVSAFWLIIGGFCLAVLLWDFSRYSIFLSEKDDRKFKFRLQVGFFKYFFDFLNVPRFATVFGAKSLITAALVWLCLGAVLPLRTLPFSLLNPSWFNFSGTPVSILMQLIQTAESQCKSQTHDKILTPCETQYVSGTFYVVNGLGFMNMYPVFAGLGLIGIVLLNRLTRKLSTKYQGQPKHDKRPPILYLRPFHTDRSPLKWKPRLLSSFLAIVPGEPRTIDEIVLHECCADGPIIAIGRPDEEVPPLGAARLYVEGDNWKEVVLGLAKNARYIIIATEPTDGVIWEVDQIIANGWAEKTLFILTDNISDGAREIVSQRLLGGLEVLSNSDGKYTNGFKPLALMRSSAKSWLNIGGKSLDRYKLQAILEKFRRVQNSELISKLQ